MVALDLATGEERWRFTVRDRYRIAPNMVMPVAYGPTVVLQIRGFDPAERAPTTIIDIVALIVAEDGGGIWTQEFTSAIPDPVPTRAPEGDRLDLLGTREGATIVGEVAAWGRVLVPLSNGSIVGLNRREALPDWQVDGLGRDGFGLGIAGGHAYTVGRDGNVRAFDLASGEEVWRVAAARPLALELAVAGGAVYVGDDDGALYAYAAADGTPTPAR